MELKVKKFNPEAKLPAYSRPQDAGLDLTAVDDGVLSEDGTQITYRTGIGVELPENTAGLLMPRSSICKYSLNLSNSVGLLDENFRGEIKFVFNVIHNREQKFYNKGDRLGQLLIVPVVRVSPKFVGELSRTDRGENGFGSSNK